MTKVFYSLAAATLVGLASTDELIPDLKGVRESIATQACQSYVENKVDKFIDECVDSTVAESATVDYLTTIVQNAVEDETYDEIADITTQELEKLQHWTIDIPYGTSLEEYIERL